MAHQQFILIQLLSISTLIQVITYANKYIVQVMQLSQKPKSLFCYACGRQFGTTSLSIHLKSCLKKFQIEQSKKQAKDRRKLPEPPEELDLILNGNLDLELIQVYNKKASNTHKYEVLPKCRFCSRTFNEQSLKAHQNGCSKKGNQKVQQKPSYNLPDNLKKPRTLTCCVCGREFGLTSLKIHYPQCLQKFKDDEKKKLKPDRREPPQFTQQQIDIINNKQEWTLQEIQAFNNKANESYKEKSMVQCPNCGRRFLQASYLKHKKNCVMLNGDKNSNSESKPSQSTPKANFRQTTSQFKKPRTLTCCVCGRDFGLTSLKIHYPQCLEKFKTDQLKKPKNQRRVPPQFSQEQLEIINNKQDWTMQEVDEFNNKSSGHYRDKGMVQCQNCGRKFLQESYLKHKKNCALINGKKNNALQQNRNVSNDAKLRPSSSQYKKPRTLTCCVCGREFGLTSLKIHYPQCLQKFHNDEKKKPKEERKVPPEFGQQELQMINNKEDWTTEQIEQFNSKANEDYRNKAMVECPNCGRKFLQASYLKHKKNCVLINGANQKTESDAEQSKKQSGSQLKKPKVLMCYICGRQFGLTSLTIHHPKCKQKFQNIEKKKEKEQRRPVPHFPEDMRQKFNLQNAIEWQIDKIQQYNKIANEIYRAQSLCACPICGRKFFEESLAKHIKFCEKNKQKQVSIDQKGKLNQSKSKSLSKQPGLNKKSSYLSDKSEIIKKIEQETQEQLLNSSPQDIKQSDNESFLRKSFYQKLKNSSENKKIENNISQVDQSMEETLKETNKNINAFKIEQNQSVVQQSVKKEQESISKEQNESSPQKKSQKLLDKIKKKKIKQLSTPIRQSRLRESQMRQSKNNSQIKQSAKKIKQVNNNKSQLNKSVAIQSIKNRPESRYKDTKTNSRPASRKNQSNTSMQMSKKNEKKQMNENKVQSKTHKLEDIIVDLPVKDKAEGKNKQVPRQILSPMEKARQSKGFAAPRKKEETNLANMKECKICKRKFDEERIEKHQKACIQNQQKKSDKIIKNTEQMNESIRLKTQKNEESNKQQINERDVLSPQEKIRLKKGFAAPRQKQSQIQSLMAQCRGCKRKFTSDRIQKHEGICKLAQQSLKQPFTTGTYKKIQQSANTIQGQKLSIKRVGCPKCNRKFAEERLQKHVQICKAIPTETNEQKTGNGNNKTEKKPLNGVKQTSYAIDEAAIQAEKQASQNMNLQMCQKCGRKFLAERMAKHSQVCKGTNSLSLQPNFKKDALKKQKQLPPTKQYNLQKLQIKEESQVDTRVQCPRCCRKFLPDRLDKHLNACKAVPPLNNIQSKPKIPKEINQLKQQKPNLKISMGQSPKEEQKLINTIGDDQYVETQLEACPKCCRKFVPDRLPKHIQICKGNNKPKTEIDKKGKNAIDSNSKKINDEELKKTKNEFFNMVKDLKNKKVKEEDVQKQLDGELQEIQETIRVHRKQNINRENSDKKRAKQSISKSINLPKI